MKSWKNNIPVLLYAICAWGTLNSVSVSGQPVSVVQSGYSLTELFAVIEKQTDYRIFYNPAEINTTIRPDVSFSDSQDPLPVLENALKNTPLKMSVSGKNIFILADKELLTLRFQTADEDQESIFDYSLLFNRNQTKATSENLIYEVGNSSLYKENTTAALSGTVFDSKTMEPLPGVNVYLDGGIGTATDRFGYYTLQIPTGKHELHIRGGGARPTARHLMVYSDGKLDIELDEQVHNLKEVTIVSERLSNIKGTIMGLEKLKVKDIKNIPMAFGEVDILKVVMSLPGVKSVGEISSGYNVRGGATDQNLILFNEGMIYNSTHLFGLFSVFNPDVVRDIEFYKTSIPSKYGGRISSVLEVNTREGNKKEFTGSASIGLLTSRLTVEAPLAKDRTSLIIGGRTTYSDWILKQLPEKSGFNDGRAGFYDVNLLLSHKVNNRNNLYVSGYYSADRFRFEENEKYSYRNANASAKWRQIISNELIGTYSVGYDHYDFDSKNTKYELSGYKYGFAIDQFFAKADFNRMMGNGHSLSFGFNTLLYNLQPGNYDPEGENSIVVKDAIQEEKALESALYIGDLWEITPDFSVNAGFRLSMFNVLGKRSYNKYDPQYLPSLSSITEEIVDGKGILKTYLGPEFRLSGRYAFSNDFSVKAGFNTMKQYIHKLSNTTIMAPTDTWKLSDVNIKPQSGRQFSLGFFKNFADDMFETSVEGYYKVMKDYLDYRSGAELVMNHHIETDVVNTEGRAYGVEFMWKKVYGKLNGWLSYTFSKTELRQSDKKITLPVNDGEWYPADFDKPHEVKMVANYRFTHRYSVSVNCEYSTGRPVTLPVSKFTYSDGEHVYYSKRNQYRIPDYFRTDLSFNIEPSHNLTLLTHSMFSIGVYNLTGRKNPYSVYYVSENGTLHGYQMSIYGTAIPYVSYNIKF